MLEKIGPDAFRELVDEELTGEWAEERDYTVEVERLRFDDDEEAGAPAAGAAYGSPNGDRSLFDVFLARNVTAQRQPGFSAVAVKVTRGDLTPEQFRGLAAIMREYCGGYARCGQHHIGTIGFYGASLKIGDRQMPAYIPHIGGRAADGDVAFGKRLKSRLPAKRVPDAVERWLRMYEADRNDGEDFDAFAGRVGNEPFEAKVKDLTLPVEFSLETMEKFIDWNRSSPYKVERGEGECAI